MKKRLFECSFTEYNGEQEYFNKKLIYAKDSEEAEKTLMEFLKGWYDDEAAELTDDGNGYEFFCGCPTVKVKSIVETTKKVFMKEQLDFALIL